MAKGKSKETGVRKRYGSSGQVVTYLRKQIRSGLWDDGSLVPSEQELADRFDVSRKTIRTALQSLEDEGLIHFLNRRRIVCNHPSLLDTPAQPGIATGTFVVLSGPSGLATDNRHFEAGSLVWIKLAAIGAVQGHGNRVLLAEPPLASEQNRVEELIHLKPAGIIAFRELLLDPTDTTVLAQLKNAGIAIAVFADAEELPDYDTVQSDHAAGAYQLTSYLAGRGCSRIIRFWELSMRESRYPAWLRDRDTGFEKAVKQYQLDSLPAIHCVEPPLQVDNPRQFEMRTSYLADILAQQIHNGHRFDAIMPASDSQVFSLAAACRKLKLTPGKDVLIVGYDNFWQTDRQRIWEPSIPEATVDKNNLAMGRELASLLQQRVDGKLDKQSQHRRIEPMLICNN